MVMTGEGRVLKPAAVQPGGEQLHATAESDLLVVLTPEPNNGHGRLSTRKFGGNSDNSR